jgi:outer membrane receptor protein involved in Fe transport
MLAHPCARQLLRRATLLLLFGAVPLAAQRPTQPDTARADSARADSVRARSARGATRLNAVQVVATPAERAAPVSATHISTAEIRQTPAQNGWDLLRQTAGVEVHLQGQGPGFASDASVRGFSSDHSTDLALWVDGVPINEPVNGHAEGYNDWSVLFPGGIQDVDVIKGPTSALFGNFALAGVVNVRTLERMKGTEVTGTVGSFGRVDAMGMTGFDHGAMGGGVFGIHLQHEDGFRPNSAWDLGHAHARVVHDLSSTVRIDGGAELYGSRWDSPGYLSEQEFAQREYDVVSNPTDGGYRRRAQERASVRVFAGSMLWRTTAYATQGQWRFYLTIPPAGGRFEGSGSQTEEVDDRYGFGLTSALTLPLPAGEVTVGVEGRRDHSHFQNWFTTSRLRDSLAERVFATQLSGALFAQAHSDLTSRLRVDVGARYDALDTRSLPDAAGAEATSASHGIVTPKLGALLRVTDAVGLFANGSRGFRSTDGIISDPTLPFITEWAYEAGLKYDRSGVSATATLFRMNVSNEQTFNPVTLESTSGGASRRQGLELAWQLPVATRAAFSGDWTFLDARYRSQTAEADEGDGPPMVLDGLRVFNTAQYVGDATLEIAATSALALRIGGNFVGPYSPFDEPGVVRAPYGLLHLGGAWESGHSEIDFGVRNVLDRAYPELAAGGIVAPGQPRAVFVSVRRKL